MKIANGIVNFEREKLISPFGFKGGYIDEIWQIVVKLYSEKGYEAIGLGTQSILWSDPEVFSSFTPVGGNSIMLLLTEYAAKKAATIDFVNPIDLMERLLPEVLEYGKHLTGLNSLRTTFALNAMVPIDFAAWVLYCKEKGLESFDSMIPSPYIPYLPEKNSVVAAVPLITYGSSMTEVAHYCRQGSGLLKIKIGNMSEANGNVKKMLEWDKQRVSEIHKIAAQFTTSQTETGNILYYLDINGQYREKDNLLDLLDFIGGMNITDRIALIEEPFPENLNIDVSECPVVIAADESAHSADDAVKRIQLGYRAIALKPIAKTLSFSLKTLKAASDLGVDCFCADLTVTPVLVDWNKNLAARIKKLPGMNVGILEANGSQYYKRWRELESFHPNYGSSWITPKNGLFNLDEDFYKQSGGILRSLSHYNNLVG